MKYSIIIITILLPLSLNAETSSVINNFKIEANSGGNNSSNISTGKSSAELDIFSTINGEIVADEHIKESEDGEVSIDYEQNTELRDQQMINKKRIEINDKLIEDSSELIKTGDEMQLENREEERSESNSQTIDQDSTVSSEVAEKKELKNEIKDSDFSEEKISHEQIEKVEESKVMPSNGEQIEKLALNTELGPKKEQGDNIWDKIMVFINKILDIFRN